MLVLAVIALVLEMLKVFFEGTVTKTFCLHFRLDFTLRTRISIKAFFVTTVLYFYRGIFTYHICMFSHIALKRKISRKDFNLIRFPMWSLT